LLLYLSVLLNPSLFAQISLSEQWRLDPDVDDVPVWMGSKLTIDADKDGNVYLADFAENRILVFNNEGKFVKQIGRAGDGPGEFRRLAGIDLLNNGSIVITENYGFDRKVKKLDAKGKELESGWLVSLPHPFGGLRYRRDGLFYIAQVWKVFGREKAQEAFGPEVLNATRFCLSILKGIKLPVEMELSCSLTKRTKDFVRGGNNMPLYLEDAVNSFKRNSESAIASWTDNHSLFQAQPDQYVIYKFDSNLEKTQTYQRKDWPFFKRGRQHRSNYFQALMEVPALARESDKLDESFASEAVLAAELPQKLRPILGLIPVDDALLVLRGYDTDKNQTIADFWDEEGTFKGEVRLPKMFVNLTGDGLGHKRKTIFRKGYAFIMEPKGTEYVLVCYRYSLD
jgi:hypothetical protein